MLGTPLSEGQFALQLIGMQAGESAYLMHKLRGQSHCVKDAEESSILQVQRDCIFIERSRSRDCFALRRPLHHRDAWGI